MYFDFEDYHPDIQRVERAISVREGVMVSWMIHSLFVLYLIFGPKLPGTDQDAAQRATLAQPPRQDRTFVFVQPKVDLEALKPPPRAPDSDKNREARTRERPPNPTNTMPFSRGNTPERTEADLHQPQRPRGSETATEPQPSLRDAGGGDRETPKIADGSIITSQMPPPDAAARDGSGKATAPGSALGDALRHLDRYVQKDSFDNPQGGGGQPGATIQFDSKGVEFGPWIRRFIAQVKRNWLIPYAAMSMKGHVVVTFYVHKDGTISALMVQGPSPVDAFNNAAYNALAASNPTQPLPPEYPADRAFFTVTFFYNEAPPQ
jgi:TonB family protein